jgi:hypothetical protein
MEAKLPKTPEEAILKIIKREDLPLEFRNFLIREADRLGVSYDADEPDQFKPNE